MQSPLKNRQITGWWAKGDTNPEPGDKAIKASIIRVTHPIFLVNTGEQIAVAQGGTISISGSSMPSFPDSHATEGFPLCAYAPQLHPQDLGDPLFKHAHQLRYAYVMGAMANGITSVEMVEAAGRAGMMGFFGSAGLTPDQVEAAIDQLQNRLGDLPFGLNLIYSPNDPALEAAVVDLYLRKGVRRISASAYLDMTIPLIHYRVSGIHQGPDGEIICPNKLIAKVSRIEVARKFFSPPPEKFLNQLLEKKVITREEAELARQIPVAEDLTAEADSGGHTDNRPALALLPTMIALRNELGAKHGYKRPLCVGLGGGIATPESVAAAFAMGAAYVLTGSVNQACTEAGISEPVRHMLAEARQSDVIMAPAADMFEMGVKVQVLKHGTMFPLRAAKLYDLYCACDSLETIPAPQKAMLERDFFHCSLEEAWQGTQQFFSHRDPAQITRAEKEPKHKMALVFRSYLGRASRWAITGEPARRIDYQIWCGPAMGAFNEWVSGSFLEKPENRKVVTVAMNLLAGAALVTRANWLRTQGIVLPPGAGEFSPMELSKIYELIDE